MSKETILQELPTLIKHCFGEQDLIFCSNTTDEDRAYELLKTAKRNEIEFTTITEMSRKFLKEKEATEEHINEQINKITRFFCSLRSED